MLPYKNLIKISETTSLPKYIQISNHLIKLIKAGTLPIKTKLPGSRSMSSMLSIHRKTVIASYEELLSQGWIEVLPSKGTFVSSQLPIINHPPNNEGMSSKNIPLVKTRFTYQPKTYLYRPDTSHHKNVIYINDGLPDTRIAPITDIAKRYRSLVGKSYFKRYLSYGSIYGNDILRQEVVRYLNETRGLNITIDNILITHGSQMGIYLSSQLLLKNNESIIVGESNYIAADMTFKDAGASLIRVDVDDYGINTDQVAEICEKKSIRAVYITPHHHHPTTVTLSAKRRMHLLELSYQYKFAIIEDDYDYDFHYAHAPTLPIASSDNQGSVIYIGALCKIVVPGIRIGYMIAPKEFIDDAAQLRRIIDRQGDTMMELAFAHMIKEGDLQRHSNKALKIYHERRGLFCDILSDQFKELLEFKIPDGGMAVWAKLKTGTNWKTIKDAALLKGVQIEPHEKYNAASKDHSGIRMGFASLNNEEIVKGLSILSKVMR